LGDVALDEPIFVSLFAGGIGAIVSVMTRVTRGNLALEREISNLTAVLLGGVRPFIGAIFGGLLFVLIEGNVISIAPGGTDPTFVTYAGLAFIAGFSERIAKSAIETAEDTITGDAEIGADAAQPSAKPV
jgi:ABC-type branched-subunit amino acid transport system permease subunit